MQVTAKATLLQERKGFHLNGTLVAVVEIALVLVAAGTLFSVALVKLTQSHHAAAATPLGPLPSFVLLLIALVMVRGFRMVRADQALVLYSHHHYVGTIRGGGLIWTSPFLSRRKVSLQPHALTVNAPGAPRLAAEITWRVTDTAKALFGTEHYVDVLQAEAVALLGNSASRYGQNPSEADGTNFRRTLQERVEPLGVSVERVALRIL